MKKRSQVSIETVAAVGIALVLFMFMSFFAFNITRERQTYEENALTENQCLKIAAMLEGMQLSSQGTEFNITLDYNTTFSSGSLVHVRSENTESSCITRIDFTNGTSGEFMIGKGPLSMQNILGTVTIIGG